jgi:thiol-disulfide isomerase/thioredoxin
MKFPSLSELLSARRLRRLLLEVLMIIGVVVALQAWQLRHVRSGDAPQFTGVRTDGQAFDMSIWRMQNPGRPVALHFWAEWCPICKMEEGSITSLARDWPLMTVAMQSGDVERVKAWMQREGTDWPTLLDTDGKLAGEYGLRAVPAFVVIKANGEISSVSLGYTSELSMRARLWWAQQG